MYDDVRKAHMLCHCQFFCLQLCHSIRLPPLDREVSMMSGVEGSVTGDASEKVLDVRSRIFEALNLDGSGTHGTRTYSDLVTSINESKGVCKKVKRSDSPKKST